MKFQFLKPSKGTEIGSRNQDVCKIKGKFLLIFMPRDWSKNLLQIIIIERCEKKSKVRKFRIPQYHYTVVGLVSGYVGLNEIVRPCMG